ncbi:hypothetical protein P171DRAFT_432192, partial [Karstenula rhodostoma CBS 690.94]
MRSVTLLLFFLSGTLSKAQVPFLPDPQRKYVLDVIARALEEEDPVVRQALVATIGFPYIPYQTKGLSGNGRVIIFIGIMMLLINLFCLYVICLWSSYIFQKRGIRNRYQRRSTARNLRLEQEDFLFKQQEFLLRQEAERKFNKA